MIDKGLIVFGTGTISDIAYACFGPKIVAFTDEMFLGDVYCDRPVIPFDLLEKKYSSSKYDLFLAVGYGDGNRLRERLFHEGKKKGYHIRSFGARNTCVGYGVQFGEGWWIQEQNNIQHFAKVGNNCILWAGNHIGHHSVIGDHCFISSHVVVSGNCKIGRNCFIGVNATIADGIVIGDYCTIGAGALVVADVPDNITIKGKWGKSELHKYEHQNF